MTEGPKRHCWECLRRRLVCDFEAPGCKRCAASGVDCPGYGETPPLRVKWLAPGKVKSRQRKGTSNRQKNSKVIPESATASSASSSPAGTASDTSKGSPESSTSDSSSDDIQKVAVPRSHLKTDYHALIDSVEYFNSCMYPQLAVALRLGTNTNIYKLSPTVFHLGLTRPPHLQLSLICLTLSHRMNQTYHDPDSKALESTFYRYRGQVIRSLNEDLNKPYKRNSDVVFAGILTLLLVDAQQGISQHWRYHIEGVRRLIMLRGGLSHLAVSPGVLPIILAFVHFVVLADTTSPASDLLVDSLDLEELYDTIERYGGNGYGFQMCPTPLFIEIIKINHIRHKMSISDGMDVGDLQRDACEVLRRVYNFSPDKWTEANELLTEESRMTVEAYHSAVALYCMSSLSSIGVLPPDPLLRSNCEIERGILHGILSKALRQRSYGYIFWPLMVLGANSANGNSELRQFVREQMVSMSASSGTYAPLAAKETLEGFWDSGNDTWDECFDRPQLFTTVLTVNRGQLPKRGS